MEPIIFQSHHDASDTPLSPEKVNGPLHSPRLAAFSQTRDSSISWGRRHHHGSWLHALGCAGIMLLCPCLVIFLWISLSSFGGSLMAAYNVLLDLGPINFFLLYGPRSNAKVSLGYGAWILFQIALYQFLPSKLSTGQLTPAGNLLNYRTNGLLAWTVTHVLFVALAVSGLMDPAILARHWEPLLVTANIAGFLLTGFVYAKAHLSPTHEKDRKFSGKRHRDVSG
jgi:7-dehydrocholesterol reductase